MDYHELVYKCPGEHHAHGGVTYKYRAVNSEDELNKCLSDGWHASLIDAVDAFKNPNPVIEKPIPPDNAEPTREELELKATELGIKFDGRTNDAKLLKMINERI